MSEPTITDEELAEIEIEADRIVSSRYTNRHEQQLATKDLVARVPRIIAALRAERAEVERLDRKLSDAWMWAAPGRDA